MKGKVDEAYKNDHSETTDIGGALNDKLVEALKPDFIKKYEEAYKAVFGENATIPEDDTGYKAISEATTLEDLYSALDSAVDGLLNDYAGADASKEVKAIVSEYQNKIAAAIEDAKNAGTVPNIAGDDSDAGRTLVEEAVDAIDAQKKADEFKNDHKDILDKTADEVTADDLAKIEEALKDYEQLHEEVKDALGEEIKADLEDKLAAAEAEAAAEDFKTEHKDILDKAADDVTADDFAKIEEALEDYEALPDEVKDALGEDVTASLEEKREEAIKDGLAEEYAEAYEAIYGALPLEGDTTLTSIENAANADKAYEALKDGVADLISDLVTKDDSLDVQIAAEEYKEQISGAIDAAKQEGTLPDIAGVTSGDGQTLVEEAKEAIEALRGVEAGSTDAEKAEAQQKLDDILNEMLEKLDASPVSGVSVGDIKPDKTPSVDGGTGDYEPDHDGSIWGIVTNDSGMPGSIQLVIEETESDKLDTIESAAASGSLVSAEGSELTAEEMRELLSDKDIKCALDIYLLANGVVITEFEGYYRIMVLLPEAMRDMSGLQVVFVADDGSVEVFETSIEDGKYLVFTTAHFSEFYILGDTEVSLWWLIILLAVFLVIELILIVWLVVQKNDKKEKTAATYSVAPVGLLAVVLVPNGAVAACIVLGILCIAGAVIIAVLLAKKDKKQEPQQQEDTKQN